MQYMSFLTPSVFTGHECPKLSRVTVPLYYKSIVPFYPLEKPGDKQSSERLTIFNAFNKYCNIVNGTAGVFFFLYLNTTAMINSPLKAKNIQQCNKSV